MSKRIIGLILAIAALVVIVIAAIRYNSYTSILEIEQSETPVPAAQTAPVPVIGRDKAASQPVDSLVVSTDDTLPR